MRREIRRMALEIVGTVGIYQEKDAGNLKPPPRSTTVNRI